MTAFVISLLTQFWPYIALALGGLAWGIKQKRAGRKEIADQIARDRAKAVQEKKELDDEIANLGPADLDTRFKRWLQDGR